MGWIALSDQTRQVFDLAGIGATAADGLRPVRHDLSPNSLLVRGSLMFEMRLPGDGRPRRLLGYHRDHPWISSLSVQELPTGGIALVITQGRDVFHTVLEHDAVTQAEELRVTYSWDAPARWGRLAIERIRSGRVFLKELHDPKPLLLNDLQVMTLDPLQRQMDRSVLFFAVSDAVEPIGPMPSLTAQVPVLTDRGYRAAARIRRGDLLRTGSGELVPVLHVISREVPSLGSFAPVLLRAPYFGLQRDLVVGAEQYLRTAGSAVEYLFGRSHVRIPATHLVNGVSAIRPRVGDTLRYYQFVTPGNEPCIAAGALLETQFLGRKRRDAALMRASLLSEVERARLPEHLAPSCPLLDQFEAITLAELRAA
jgi:hypothetical protein